MVGETSLTSLSVAHGTDTGGARRNQNGKGSVLLSLIDRSWSESHSHFVRKSVRRHNG